MRIRGAKTELEEAGLETDGMVESTATLRAEIEALSGVDIMEADGKTFKSTYAILDELAQKWEDLSDIQQATITELIAGKRQGNVISSLMQNFDTARKALDTSLNSSGSAMKEHAKWSESLEARLNKLKSTWQSLSQTFLKSDFLKTVLDAVIGLVNGLDKLIDTFGLLPTLLTAFAAFKSFSGKGFFKVIEDEASASGKRITSIFADAFNAIKSIKGSGTFSFSSNFSTELNNDIQSINNFKAAVSSGMNVGEAFDMHMLNASNSAQVYARSMDTSSLSVKQFETNQRMSQISLQAQGASLSTCNSLILAYNGGLAATGLSQQQFLAAIRQTNPQLYAYLASLNGATGSMGGYIMSLISAKAATIGLEIATTALNAVIGMGIGLIISGLFSAISKWINAEKELAEKVDEVTSKFKEQHEELQKLKGDYDTSNESSMISKYEKLSKGVDNLGRNVSLTADEYSEYQSIVNKIADQIPSLITGYDSQGNALLSVKGNVEELTTAYENLIKAQNNKILSNLGDIEKDFGNAVSAAKTGKDWWRYNEPNRETVEILEKINNGTISATEITSIAKDINSNQAPKIISALNSMGYDISSWDYLLSYTGVGEDVVSVVADNPERLQTFLDNYYSELEAQAEEMKIASEAVLSKAFDTRDAKYYDMSDTMKNVAHQVVGSFDFAFFEELQEKGIGIDTYINDMLKQFNSIDADDSAGISAAFDLKTQFNGNEISYGEYVKGLENTGKLIDGLDLDPELKSQLKLSIGLNEDGLVDEYQRLRNRLASDEYFDIMPEGYVPFIESLSSEELSVLWKIIPELEQSDYKESIADIKAALEKEMMLQGLTFDLNLEVEATGLEALNTALAESVSATGLSSESITALKGRYADLESQGYDLSSMFEETSHGIRLNRQEFNKLEKAYATEKLAEVDGELAEMKKTYDDLGEAIKNCDDPIRKSELYNDRQTLAQRISEAATLASQYEGLTSAYNDWLAAEEAGQERDMYENIISGFETVDDEISRGWIDDGAIEFLELLTGRTDLAGKSGKQLKEIYDGLDDTIKNTTYSIRDFFTVDEDGNSTNTGVYNFLDAIGQLEEEKFGGKDVVKRDKDGNVIGFDFQVVAKKDENGNIIKGGDEVIAEALGISEELVQIMVRAADDAGFVISMDGTYRQLADLQNEAKESAEYLKSIGKTDFEFDFNTSSVENLKTQLEEAHKILDSKEFWNKDGTFNFDADGATEAMQVVSTLQAKLDKLTEDKYGIGLTVEDEEFEEPLENLQEYGRKIQTLNQLELNPEANAEEIESLNGELESIAKYFAELDNEKKVKIGLVTENGKTAFTEEYFNSLSKEKKIEIGLVNDKGEPLTDYVDAIQKKIESGEIEIPTVLDIQTNMDKNLETLADLALLESGLLSDSEEKTIKQKYNVEVEADNIDTSDVEDKVDNAVIDGLGNPILSRESNIKIIAETFGIEDVDNLSAKLEGLDDKTIQAIAEAVGKGDVDALQIAIEGMDGNTVQAVAEALGYSDVETLKAAVRNMEGNEVDAKVNTDGQAQKVWDLQSVIDGLKGKTVDIVTNIKKVYSTVAAGGKKKAAQRTGADPAGNDSEINGTAHVNGTIGSAFKQGSWGIKNSGTALVGELGAETLVRDGRYYTIGDTGAEFIKYKKGDIIFNHRQTEELFANGKVTSGGGRGKALAEGTAFSSGSGGIGKVKASTKKKKSETTTKTTTKKTKDATTTTTTTTTKTSKRANSSSGSSGSGGSNKVEGSAVGTQDEFEETFDWVAVAIERIEREIDNLDQTVGNVYKSWGDRNTALSQEITKVGEEIALQNNAATQYLQQADAVGLNESWAAKVRNGTLDISTITDEDTAEKIKEYQQWYELYLGCTDKAEQLKQTESELYEQRFENVQSQYDGILQGYEHTESMLNEYIAQAEAKGHIISKKYYDALIKNEESNIAELKREQADLIAKRDEAVASGAIVKGSQAWYDMCAEIDGVTQAIEEGNTALIEYSNSIRDIDWQVFDLIQERISDITAEADFLIDLMSYDKLFDDNGKLTDKGMATMGLHGQNYNTYMYAADEYANEIAKLDKQIAKDPYDQELINRRRELVEAQRESILAAEDEKQAIKDLVEEGINLELDALQERIDLHNEELDSMKDLYDYQKNVQEQTENIASLQKQLRAYEGFDDEETRATVQKLKVELESAQQDLQETEYDKYIADQTALLDELFLEYENVLNTRLDDTNALITQVIDAVNIAAGAEGTINTVLGDIRAYINRMVDDVDKDAITKVNANKTTTSAKKDPTKKTNSTQKKNTTTTNKSSGDGKPKIGDKVKFLSGKYYYDSQGVTPAGSKNHGKQVYITNINKKKWATHPYHISTGKKLGSGDLGWLKLNQISGYATGKKNFTDDEIAWTQENDGREFIVRPSDGAILTPIAKGDSVLTSAASNNIWDMANSPADFIKDNLKFGADNMPNTSNVQTSYIQNFENITFSMPNVHGYSELLREMQKDPKFEKLILSMTIDQIAGKSSLTKGKSIR